MKLKIERNVCVLLFLSHLHASETFEVFNEVAVTQMESNEGQKGSKNAKNSHNAMGKGEETLMLLSLQTIKIFGPIMECY